MKNDFSGSSNLLRIKNNQIALSILYVLKKRKKNCLCKDAVFSLNKL